MKMEEADAIILVHIDWEGDRELDEGQIDRLRNRQTSVAKRATQLGSKYEMPIFVIPTFEEEECLALFDSSITDPWRMVPHEMYNRPQPLLARIAQTTHRKIEDLFLINGGAIRHLCVASLGYRTARTYEGPPYDPKEEPAEETPTRRASRSQVIDEITISKI
ncbi:hypothetical protein CMI48_01445 [Candidatus Pacearchaeota archaeon]|nr:hypothetical protein [Candidatus Pacearchaeota archaeon]